MPTWIKRTILIVLSLITIVITTGFFFHQKNSQFHYWWNLPIENRLLSIKLEIERPFNYYLFDDISPNSYQHLTIDSLKSAIHSGAKWIVNMQEETGRFNYWYNPVDEVYSRKSEDNFLRQAGTNYSLLTAFEVLGDSSLLSSSKLNLDYLNQFLVNDSPDSAYYLYRRKAKLGGIALPMLAMLKLRNIFGDSIYDSTLKSLANMIIHLQQVYGTGQYKSTYLYNGSFSYEKDTGWESQIYPGEAMLALTEMYEAFKDPKYLESLNKALHYYSRDGNWKHFSFMPWTTIAMSKIAILTEDVTFADFAFQMTDRLLYWQNLNEKNEAFGSLFGVPTVFTSTWMEGVGAALELAKHVGDKGKEKFYYQQLMISFNWLLRLQYTENDLHNLGLENAALGGFRRSLVEPEIRIDNTQHAISSLIKALQYLK